MIGFSMAHIHPLFFLAGIVCSFVLVAWLLPAIIYAVIARFRLKPLAWWMAAGSLIAVIALFLPDSVGLAFR